jgi:hypothetical protein
VRLPRYLAAVLLAGVAFALPTAFHPSGHFFFSLAGLFVVSLVSNATPFFGASYTLVATTYLISFGFSIQAFILVVMVTALGAALGKVVIYGGAKGFERQLSRNKNVQLLEQWMQHRGFYVALFVTAVVPLLPLDDYAFIGAGASEGKLTKMLAVTVAAKLLKSAVEVGLEYFGILRIAGLTRRLFGLSSFQLSLILSVVFIALGVFLFKYDWQGLLDRLQRRKTQPGIE